MNPLFLCALAGSIAALFFIMRGMDVRLVLFSTALLLAAAAGNVFSIFDVFLARMGDGQVVGPICSAMGFAFVIRITGCDREMVRALLKPLQGMRWLLIPGGCAVGFLTNMAITSQTAAAAAVGPILIPLMIAAGFHPATAAATLVLGCSAGGNLFNPGEPDVVNIHVNAGVTPYNVIGALAVPELAGIGIAIVVFLLWEWRRAASSALATGAPSEASNLDVQYSQSEVNEPLANDRVNVLRALMPPVPVVLLFLSMPSLGLFPLLQTWYPSGIPVVHVMIAATILTMLVVRKDLTEMTKSFFEGLGYGFTNVISLIIVASCFIESLRLCGVMETLVRGIASGGPWGYISAGVSTFALAIVSGSGTAPSIAFSKGVLPGLLAHGMDVSSVVDMGLLGAIGATFGRTMSPVAAVVIFAATLTSSKTKEIVSRLALPLCAGLVVAILATVFRL
ncbi:MAG: C4-dicarboxylate transporter DcuC [Candidatus Kapaibacterium sp.]|jgi:DcuC family C4-dicarboxylate transporter